MPKKSCFFISRTFQYFLFISFYLAFSPSISLAAHGLAQYGALKYPPGFSHFDYVNPDAPRGGTLVLSNPNRLTSFDKFNPFTLKGSVAPGVGALIFESLLVRSKDEIAAAYCLLADDVALAADGLSVTFRLRPEARFSDGTPVLAKDVKYSFDMLMSKLASPAFRSIYADVQQVVVVAERIVRFDFKRRNAELALLVGDLPIFSPAWGRKLDGSYIPFDQLAFEKPIGTGPYLIDDYQAGRNITFRRHSHYWGNNINVQRGSFNFERIRYQLYADDTIRLEAFKAGEFDALVEYRAKNWVKGFDGPKFRSGALRKQNFIHHNGAGMQGFIFNLRRPLFQNIKVREALGLALDFEWLNRQLFYGQYRRLDSYFANSELAASAAPNGLPDAAEKALLMQLDKQFPGTLSADIWEQALQQPTTTPPGSLRANLRQARRLLAQAGWIYRDGALRNAQGQPFIFEMLDDKGNLGRVVTAYVRNLEKLGISVVQRTVDSTLYQKRLDDFDFDMISLRIPDSQSPGNELFDYYSSHAAHQPGSGNFIGVQSPLIDTLLTKVVHARTRSELVTATRALDRIFLHQYYVVPQWFSDNHRIAYAAKFSYPQVLPRYYSPDDWIIRNWWIR